MSLRSKLLLLACATLFLGLHELDCGRWPTAIIAYLLSIAIYTEAGKHPSGF